MQVHYKVKLWRNASVVKSNGLKINGSKTAYITSKRNSFESREDELV